MNKHAILSPSNAEKWMNCPGSVHLEVQAVAENPGLLNSNIHADRGTLAHLMAEICLNYKKDTIEVFEGLLENVQKYVDYVRELSSPYSYHEIEKRIEIFDECYGTADCVVIDRNEMHIVDLKYGTGIVEANDNKQMMLYAYGAIKEHEHIEDITLHIVMPRGKNSSWSIKKDKLIEWGLSVEKIGNHVMSTEEVIFNPSDAACKWCKAIWICPAKNHQNLDRFPDEE